MPLLADAESEDRQATIQAKANAAYREPESSGSSYAAPSPNDNQQPVVAEPVASGPVSVSSTEKTMTLDPQITGISDPNPSLLSSTNAGAQSNVNTVGSSQPTEDVSLQDLYPETPEASGPGTVDIDEPVGADVLNADTGIGEFETENAQAAAIGDVSGANTQEANLNVGNVATPGQAQSAATGLLSQAQQMTAVQAEAEPNQNVDAELNRILGQDSPLLSRARAEAARLANQRGLQNSSMAAGMAFGALTDRALPMAQQNAAQNYQRTIENARLRQEAGMFNAAEANRLASIEAELGTQVNIFNADQLNRAEQLTAQLQTAMEQQNADAYNRAAMQLAELQYGAMIEQSRIDQETSLFNADQQNRANELMAQLRTSIEQQNVQAANQASMQLAELRRQAQAQQAELNFAAEQQRAAEQQAYNEQVIDAVTRLNQQYLQGTQAIDLATVQSQYQLLIQTNETAGNLFNNYMNSIGQVMADPKMSTSQIANAVSNMQRMLESGLNMISEINGMDFGEQVESTVPGGATYDPGTGNNYISYPSYNGIPNYDYTPQGGLGGFG